MTLQQWINKGGNMLSHMTVAFCCQGGHIPNEGTLRNMELGDIFTIPTGGAIAQREICRFARKRGITLDVCNQVPKEA